MFIDLTCFVILSFLDLRWLARNTDGFVFPDELLQRTDEKRSVTLDEIIKGGNYPMKGDIR